MGGVEVRRKDEENTYVKDVLESGDKVGLSERARERCVGLKRKGRTGTARTRAL